MSSPEPSSALAIKISRAYDNPSPPPSPSIDLGLAGFAFPSPHPFLPHLITSLHDTINGDSRIEDTTPSTPSNVGTGSSRNLLPLPSITTSTSSKTPPDLISFESFSSPAPVFRAVSPFNSIPRPSHLSAMPDVNNQALHPFNPSSSPKAGETLAVSKPISPPATCDSSRGEDVGKAKDREKAQDLQERSVHHSLSSTEEGSRVEAQLMSASHLDEPTRTLARHSSRHRVVSRYQDFDQLITRLSQPPKMSPDKTHLQSNPSHLEKDERTTLETRTRDIEEDQGTNSPAKSTFCRELGSLSPTSNDLLSSLVTSSQLSSSSSLDCQPKEASSLPQRTFLQSSPVPALPQTPRRSTGPIRLSSPSRSAQRESIKAQSQAISFDNLLCTPAQRIPIEDAIAQGHISPLKGSQLLASNSRAGLDGLHKPLLTIPYNDSPARRVPVLPEATTPVVPKKWQGMRFGSPTRSPSKERSSSVEPAASGASKGKFRERSGSIPPPVETSSSLFRTSASGPYSSRETSKPAKLPFPLVPSRRDIPSTIPEEQTVDSPTKPSQASYSSPTKSSLKHTTSRIPTRTAKPYAKPHSNLEAGRGKSSRTDMPTTDSSKSKDVGPKFSHLSFGVLILLVPLKFRFSAGVCPFIEQIAKPDHLEQLTKFKPHLSA